VLRARGEGGLLRAGKRGRMCLPMSDTVNAPTVEAVWRELHDQLLRFIARRVRTPEDAEDILQEVMLRIHRHGGDLEHADRIASWVYRIATNAIADHYRTPARRELPSGQGTEVPETDDAPAATVSTEPDAAELRAELAGCIAPLIARLPEMYREALELTEFEETTQVRAAAQLGLSVSGMKTRVQRGRGQLKDLLLECCQVELDSRGGVTAYRSNPG
jgi:RNA polymerase sigma-70 factor (ECF subfamily)